jgi:hypothetical protein
MEWMDAAPDDAIRWIEQMPAASERTNVLVAMSKKVIGDDPQLAIRLAAMMPREKLSTKPSAH